MLLSVIIVSYRVPYFLDLCLRSVREALRGLDAEVIVVDNQSADGTVDLLRPRFPEVKWILNAENTGFARANNEGLRHSSGQYILFLNPDTIVPEDFVAKCVHFLNPPPNPSDPPHLPGWPGPVALGVRMIDGNGQFLKESRRGFPTPWVAFCKLSGLTALFPRSAVFARYYLGHLPVDRTCRAPVLSGAFLFVTREVLSKAGPFDSKAGPFDESFFLYGEDIDLSYRLEKEGENYYYPDVTIIHFKGESTKKDIRYTRQFYKAMIQFRRKHFHGGGSGRSPLGTFGVFLLDPVIWLRGALSAVGRTFTRTRRPPKDWRSRLTGDPAAIGSLRAALSISEDESAGHIIYCIGKEFSFKSAIEALEKKDPGKTAAFYVHGGLAVIGSARSGTQGEIWVL